MGDGSEGTDRWDRDQDLADGFGVFVSGLVSGFAEDGDALSGDLLLLGLGVEGHSERKTHGLKRRVDHFFRATTFDDTVHLGLLVLAKHSVGQLGKVQIQRKLDVDSVSVVHVGAFVAVTFIVLIVVVILGRRFLLLRLGSLLLWFLLNGLQAGLVRGQLVLHQSCRFWKLLLHRLQHQLLVQDGIERLHLVAGLLRLQVRRRQHERTQDEGGQDHRHRHDLGDLHRVGLTDFVCRWSLARRAVHLGSGIVLLHGDRHRIRFLLHHFAAETCSTCFFCHKHTLVARDFR
uniref:(northern house mosquito) hypothetical protein n=1 Tax=Culex pipiens TaxID=7175 RepID=A0A8D8JVY0_CULPI